MKLQSSVAAVSPASGMLRNAVTNLFSFGINRVESIYRRCNPDSRVFSPFIIKIREAITVPSIISHSVVILR
jgi:hypothetical protein